VNNKDDLDKTNTEFKKCDVFFQALGSSFVKLFMTDKPYEISDFQNHISDWECNEYLELY
jgi:glutamine synthetase